MSSYIALLQQLPHRLQGELAVHIGSTVGMAEVQIVSRYREVALHLRSAKLASLPPGYEPYPTHLSVHDFNNLGAPQAGVAQELVDIMTQLVASEGAWYLENFAHQLSGIIDQLHEAARQQAQRQAEEAARQLAQHQAEEAARQLAQRQAEEAARQLAQRQVEEAARLHAQRLAEEAAQISARLLAEQQAKASVDALALQKEREAAFQAARLVLELGVAADDQPAKAPQVANNTQSQKQSSTFSAAGVILIPGPEATAEIERATQTLKSNIDAAIVQYSSAISKHLNTGPNAMSVVG